MPDRIRARVLVTALLVMLMFAGIRAIGPAGSWARPAGDMIAVGVSLEVVLAGLYVALRWRRQPPANALVGKLRNITAAALVTALIAVPISLFLSEYHNQAHQFGYHPVRVLLPGRGRRTAVTRIGSGIGLPLRELLIAILVIAIIAVLIITWRRRRVAWPRLAGPAGLGVDEAAGELARAVESGRMALRDIDDARAAIIACYVAMEQSLAEAGAARAAAETPDELLVRAIAAGLVPRDPAGLLTELFYEARYSTHHMPVSKRDQAERALADIAAELPAGEPA